MQTAPQVHIGWAQAEAELLCASAFLARHMPLDSAYISHSEMQWGLSEDGEAWGSRAEAMLGAYFREFLEEGGQIAHAIGAGGIVHCAAAVLWSTDTPVRFATVQDIVVAPAARGHALGQRVMDFIESEARQRAMAWVFLESGVRNGRAHAFFTREGFAPVSHTFAKRLD